MSKLSAHDTAVLNCIFNPNLPLDIQEVDKINDDESATYEVMETKKMEVEAIKVAEAGDLTKGLEILNRALQIAPNRPSIYNNRALIYQYLRQFEDAFNDLTTAIDLCNENQKITKSQAYCQRGVLHRRANRPELARVDFEKAADVGNKFAKSQLVEMNPYAALCNQMLHQVMEKLK